MRKLVKLFLGILLSFSLLSFVPVRKAFAYDALYSGFWVGNVLSDGSVENAVKVSSYSEGISKMKSRTSTSSSVASLFYNSQLVTSRYATLDFSAVPNVYTNSYMYTILDDGSTVRDRKEYANGYYYSGGVCLYADSGYDSLSSGYDFYVGTYIGGLHSRIYRVMDDYYQYEIIPISMQEPLEYYTLSSSGSIVHYYQAAVVKTSSNPKGMTSIAMGKAPDFFRSGVKYYSADQHYFYDDYMTMVDDLNDRTHANALNKTPWVNYYQFLPFHTSTKYTAAEMDQYFIDLGFTGFAYQLNGDWAKGNESVLYESGTYFMQTQQIYGINPIMLFSISVNETGWGQSPFAVNRRNLFGINAYDSDPGAASSYSSVMESVFSAAELLTEDYFVATGNGYYNGAFLGNKDGGANVAYASDPLWGEKAASYYYQFDLAMGLKDYNNYTIGLSNSVFIKVYDAPGGTYIYNSNGTGSRYVRYSAFLILGEDGEYYKVLRDASLDDAPDWTDSGNTTKFDFENTYAYIKKSDLTIVNSPSTLYVSPVNSEYINKLRLKDDKKTVKVTSSAPVYTDAYLGKSLNVTVAKNAVVYSDETAYTQDGYYSYKIIYNSDKGLCGWIRATKAEEQTGNYAVRSGTIETISEAPVYANLSDSEKSSVVSYYREGAPVLSTSGDWYKVTYDAVSNKTGWVRSSWFESKKSHTASGIAADPAELSASGEPVITEQPAGVSVSSGTAVSFTVKARGNNLQYQWYYRTSSSGTWMKSSASCAKTATYTISASSVVTARDGYQYRCVVSNENGSATSSAATLHVTLAKPVIKTQPQNVTVSSGTKVTFSVKATGEKLNYQWYYRKSASGTWTKSSAACASSSVYELSASSVVSARNGYQYRCVVSNEAGSVTSDTAALTVVVLSKPVITAQSKNTTVSAGSPVSFHVDATGGLLSYQWYYRTSSSGTWMKSSACCAKTATYTLSSSKVVTARSGYQYRCVVKNAKGSVTSDAISLTVIPQRPVILTQPASVTVSAGTPVTFRVEAKGENLKYQWYYRTGPNASWSKSTAACAKTPVYERSSEDVTLKRNGYEYRCVVMNEGGAVTSEAAVLHVQK